MSLAVEIGLVPELSDEQATRILEIGLAASYYERDDGQIPADPVRRQEDAVELVRQCRLSARAGNDQKSVLDILFAAEADFAAKTNSSKGEPTVSATAQSEDLSQFDSQMLGKILETLGNHDPSEDRDNNIDIVKEEILRRANAGDQDAESIAQTFTTTEAPPQPAAATAVDRDALENQITFPMMRANGIDPSQIPSLSDGELQWLIDHPNGAGAETSAATTSAAADVDATTQMPAAKGDTVQTTRMVAVPQEQLPPDETPAITPGAPVVAGGVSAERLALEEQITGPTLKVYGVGRKDVADGTIGDNELRFMIEHPDGKVSMDELQAAQALDRQQADVQPESGEEDQPTIAEQRRAQKAQPEQPAAEGDGFAPAAEPEAEKPKRRRRSAAAAQEPASSPVVEQTVVTTMKVNAPANSDPPNPIADDLARENMLVPAEIEEQVRLPFDLSKHSETEIRSYHSKFHALHSRALYKLTLWEQELKDEVKLRRRHEFDTLNSIPTTPKLTDAQRDAKVAADPTIMAHRDQERELEKKVGMWKLMADNFGRDVAVCSRQLGRGDEEASGAR